MYSTTGTEKYSFTVLRERKHMVLHSYLDGEKQGESHVLKQWEYHLFSELFKEFGGAFLEVCETSQGNMFEYFGVALPIKHIFNQ